MQWKENFLTIFLRIIMKEHMGKQRNMGTSGKILRRLEVPCRFTKIINNFYVIRYSYDNIVSSRSRTTSEREEQEVPPHFRVSVEATEC